MTPTSTAGGTTTVTGTNFGALAGDLDPQLDGVTCQHVAIVTPHLVFTCDVGPGTGTNGQFLLGVGNQLTGYDFEYEGNFFFIFNFFYFLLVFVFVFVFYIFLLYFYYIFIIFLLYFYYIFIIFLYVFIFFNFYYYYFF
jgi:hypothetical protein